MVTKQWKSEKVLDHVNKKNVKIRVFANIKIGLRHRTMPALRVCGLSQRCTKDAVMPCSIPEEQRPRCQDFQKQKKLQAQTWEMVGFILKGLLFATDKHTAHETAIRHNPHNFSN
jgi:hypothetical protein